MQSFFRPSLSLAGAAGCVASLLLCATHVAAQSEQANWRVRPIASFRSGTEDRFAVFGPTDSIELEFRMRNNQSALPLVLDAGLFPSAGIQLTTADASQENIPIAIAWTVPVQCSGAAAVAPCATDSRIVLGPGESANAFVTMRAASGDFAPGEYRLSVDFAAGRERLRQADSTPWRGRFSDRTVVTLIVQEARTETEHWMAFQLAGRQAMGHLNWAGALAQYQKMVALDPDSPEAHAGMGSALLQLGRYAEAALQLELARPDPQDDSPVPQDLALAYVAMGQDARAERVLKSYYNASQLTDILANVHERAKGLPNRP